MNKNFKRSTYETGEIVFGIQPPGADWIKLDGTVKNISPKLSSKLGLLSWTTVPGPSGTYSVAYANGTWVVAGAAGAGGNIRTSTDNAVTWNTQTSNTTSIIQSVAYGNGTWVAAGNNGTIRTSTDNAVTWNTQTSNFGTSTIYSIAYGNGTWVAAGIVGALRTSTDTVNWNTQTSNFGTSTIGGVAYGNGTWVAIGNFGLLRTSTDSGVTWNTQATIGDSSGQQLNALAYGNGIFVAGFGGGQDPSGLKTSTDGVYWRGTPVYGASTINAVGYGNGTWIISSVSQSIVRTSTDNCATLNITTPQGALLSIRAVAYGNGVWVAGLVGGVIGISKYSSTYLTPNTNLAYNIYGWMKL